MAGIATLVNVLILHNADNNLFNVASQYGNPDLGESLHWGEVAPVVVVAGAWILTAITALAAKGHARWLCYLQVALSLFVLADSLVLLATTHTAFHSEARVKILWWLMLGYDIPTFVALVLLALTLYKARRQAT